MKVCENCGNEHDGEYGSGRFCSVKCSRGFSTKAKRKEINEKVSKSLAGNGHSHITKICKQCNKEFDVHWGRRKQIVCSEKCRKKYASNPIQVEKMSKSLINAHIEGKMSGSKRAIRCEYLFKNKKIRCDSKVEYSCVNYFEMLGASDISRCDFFIEYMYDGKIKRYLPDFRVILNEEIYIVECKSFFKKTKEVEESKSWSLYYNTIAPKREALKEYCNTNGYKDFFYTKKLNKKFYDTCDIVSI